MTNTPMHNSASASIKALGRDFEAFARLTDRGGDFNAGNLASALKITTAEAEKMIQDWIGLGHAYASESVAETWELPSIVTRLFRHYTGRQRALLPGELIGMVMGFEDQTRFLREAIENGDQDRIDRVVSDLSEAALRAHDISHASAEGIENEITKIKKRDKAQSIGEKFSSILHIQQSYLKPLLDLVQTGGEMERVVETLRTEIYAGKAKYGIEHGIGRALTGLMARVDTFRRESFEKFDQAFKAFSPLFNQIREDHALSSSVAVLLESFQRRQWRDWNLEERLPIAGSKDDRPIETTSATAYLAGVIQAKKRLDAPPQPLLSARNAAPLTSAAVLLLEDLLEEMGKVGDVPDVLRWISERYVDATEEEVLGIYQQWLFWVPATAETGPPCEIRLRESNYRYTPLRGVM